MRRILERLLEIAFWLVLAAVVLYVSLLDAGWDGPPWSGGRGW